MIVFSFAKFQESALPYLSSTLGRRKVFSLWQIFVLLVLALLIKAEFSDENEAFIMIVIIFGVCSNLMLDCYHLSVVYWSNRNLSVQDIILASASAHARTLNRSSSNGSKWDEEGAGTGTREGVVVSALFVKATDDDDFENKTSITDAEL